MTQLAAGGPDAHALITPPDLNGRIPIDHPEHPVGHIDVTPAVLYFDDPAHVDAVVAAAEVESHVRGIHPVQVACRSLDDPEHYPDGISDELREQHRAEHRELNARMSS